MDTHAKLLGKTSWYLLSTFFYYPFLLLLSLFLSYTLVPHGYIYTCPDSYRRSPFPLLSPLQEKALIVHRRPQQLASSRHLPSSPISWASWSAAARGFGPCLVQTHATNVSRFSVVVRFKCRNPPPPPPKRICALKFHCRGLLHGPLVPCTLLPPHSSRSVGGIRL